MMARLANPTIQWIGGLCAAAVLLLLVSVWMINSGNPDISAYAFPPLLIGLVLLFIALAQLAIWALNRRQGPPSA